MSTFEKAIKDEMKLQLTTTLVSASIPFVVGGVAGMTATSIIQPIDTVKVRIQLTQGSSNPFKVAAGIISEQGLLGLYRGLSAGLLRQATYTTTRMGLFGVFTEQMKDEDGGLSFGKRVAAGLGSGAIGGMI